MRPDLARLEIDATLRARGFRLTGGMWSTYTGSIKVHGQLVDVQLVIPDARFVTRPRIQLIDRKQIDVSVLAHVEIDESICYASSAGLPLDNTKPGEAILRILAEAEKTLERSYKGQGVEEIADEYQHYWKGKQLQSLVSRTGDQAVVNAEVFFATNNASTIRLLAESNKMRGRSIVGSALKAKIFRIAGRLGPGTKAVRPSDFRSLREWWLALDSLSEIDWLTVEAALMNGELCFVFGANALVGFSIRWPLDIGVGLKAKKIRQTAVPKLVAKRKADLAVELWSASDCSLDRVTSRNLKSRSSLSDRRIALVGCGTIGSHLARMLLQSGAGTNEKFYLFDNDTISPGNLGRHLLNFGDIGKNKADALAQELERFHPDVSLIPLASNAIQSWSILQQCDLVIDATGDWNIQTALNELYLEDRGSRLAALLHSWVFGNGVAVQSFLNLRDHKACFRCLRPDFTGPWRYPAAQNGIATEFAPASCGDGTFAAFSVDAPVMAAALTNRAALDWAAATYGKRLRTIVIDLQDGRYHAPTSPDPSVKCPACAHLRPFT